MQKIDYNKKMKQIIEQLCGKPTLLLHSCCAPCSSAVLKKISQFFDVTVVYYNPNIYPQEEYLKRKNEQIKLLKLLNINFLDSDYDEQEFLKHVVGMEELPEGGARCNKCFYLRLDKVAQMAIGEYNFFGTTLTISPHKNAQVINQIGEALEKKYNVKFLYSDFKKENGYLNSINLSKEFGLYRQDYCGCRFSLNSKNNLEDKWKIKRNKIKF